MGSMWLNVRLSCADISVCVLIINSETSNKLICHVQSVPLQRIRRQLIADIFEKGKSEIQCHLYIFKYSSDLDRATSCSTSELMEATPMRKGLKRSFSILGLSLCSIPIAYSDFH